MAITRFALRVLTWLMATAPEVVSIPCFCLVTARGYGMHYSKENICLIHSLITASIPRPVNVRASAHAHVRMCACVSGALRVYVRTCRWTWHVGGYTWGGKCLCWPVVTTTAWCTSSERYDVTSSHCIPPPSVAYNDALYYSTWSCAYVHRAAK